MEIIIDIIGLAAIALLCYYFVILMKGDKQ
jgi:hypothetical protein